MKNELIPRLGAALALAAALGSVAACGESADPFAVETSEERVEEPPLRFRLEAGEIESAEAGPATLGHELTLPGSIGFNENRRATVVARLDGLLAEVAVDLGESVEAGQLLAVLRSRELARARTAYLEAVHHTEYARTAFEREQRLWNKNISSEEDFLKAEHDLEEANLQQRTAGQELLALGLESEELTRLISSDVIGEDGVPLEAQLTRFELRAPMSGSIVAKSAVLGEVYDPDAKLFEVADLSDVWVDLRVRAADLARLEIGQAVEVISRDLGRSATAELAYVDPRVDPDTQAALARIVLANEERVWRPGLFVTVRARVAERSVPVAVPEAAVHGMHDTTVVFVAHGGGEWEARSVVVGEEGAERTEIVSGLSAGEVVATSNGLLLKSAWLGHGGEAD
jgi:cobalt-zinc-cadmium efflux system membrane fusion protein